MSAMTKLLFLLFICAFNPILGLGEKENKLEQQLSSSLFREKRSLLKSLSFGKRDDGYFSGSFGKKSPPLYSLSFGKRSPIRSTAYGKRLALKSLSFGKRQPYFRLDQRSPISSLALGKRNNALMYRQAFGKRQPLRLRFRKRPSFIKSTALGKRFNLKSVALGRK